jgi:hypothetical protein
MAPEDVEGQRLHVAEASLPRAVQALEAPSVSAA